MKILIVCIANFCRSPVAEQILKKKLSDKFEIFSAGVSAAFLTNMDPRSSRFLESRGYSKNIHIPKQINDLIIKDADIILALDMQIAETIFKIKAASKKEIKVLNYLDLSLDLSDPFKFKNYTDYEKIMINIERSCDLLSNKIMKNDEIN